MAELAELQQEPAPLEKKKVFKFGGSQLYHVLVPRAEWGALPPKSTVHVALPARNIRYTFTDSENCYTPEECTKAVQELQKKHMEKGCSDIMYNFLVGGDCRVYEGRGWHVEGELPPKYEDLKRETIDFAFIGTFKLEPDTGNPEDRMKCGMTEALRSLVQWGLSHRTLEVPVQLDYHDFKVDFRYATKKKALETIA